MVSPEASLPECLVCFETLDDTNSTEYCLSDPLSRDTRWWPAHFCLDCLESLRDTQFDKFCHDLADTTCAREQRALLEKGPPVNLHDKHAFPAAHDREISGLRLRASKEVGFALKSPIYWCSVQEVQVKLRNAVEGEARLKLWEEQKKFIVLNEKDDDEAAEAAT